MQVNLAGLLMLGGKKPLHVTARSLLDGAILRISGPVTLPTSTSARAWSLQTFALATSLISLMPFAPNAMQSTAWRSSINRLHHSTFGPDLESSASPRANGEVTPNLS